MSQEMVILARNNDSNILVNVKCNILQLSFESFHKHGKFHIDLDCSFC